MFLPLVEIMFVKQNTEINSKKAILLTSSSLLFYTYVCCFHVMGSDPSHVWSVKIFVLNLCLTGSVTQKHVKLVYFVGFALGKLMSRVCKDKPHLSEWTIRLGLQVVYWTPGSFTVS